eukprot:2568982-Pyramimonas_sp.AAC.1
MARRASLPARVAAMRFCWAVALACAAWSTPPMPSAIGPLGAATEEPVSCMRAPGNSGVDG